MTEPPQGLATFTGITSVLEASLMLGHGITPSEASLVAVPQADFDGEIGTLTFTFADTELVFPDCRVTRASFERGLHGEVWRLSVLDRRWKWQYGQISGRYNLRRDNFTLQDGGDDAIDTERTPQQLATLCLEAMGEVDFDVVDLPNDARPTVEWNFSSPAQALAELCEELACRVVLQLDNRVALRRVGEGTPFDPAAAIWFGNQVERPPVPDTLAVVCGPNRYQVDFPLEAVGLADDSPAGSETMLPIDSLAYKPSGGWSTVDLPYFNEVGEHHRALAQKSVFRYYRLKVPVSVPGYAGPDDDVVSRLEQLLPLEDEQVSVALESGQTSSQPAIVFGVWHAETSQVLNTADALAPLGDPPSPGDDVFETIFRRPYLLDVARGLVIFSEPVYRNAHSSGSGGSGYQLAAAAAQLVLRASCRVRDAESLAPLRYVREMSTGAEGGTDVGYLVRDEIVLTHRPSYSPSYELLSVATNLTEVNAAADRYLELAMQGMAPESPQTVSYAGLVPIELDGAIGQVCFRVGPGGATTTACFNTESPRFGTSYRQRRSQESHAAQYPARSTSPDALFRLLKSIPAAPARPQL